MAVRTYSMRRILTDISYIVNKIRNNRMFEIIHHSKIMIEKKFLENPEVIVNLKQDIIEGQTCVFIICQTQSNAFLTATGIFEQTNLTIHDAKVIELNNGYSI